MARENYTSQPEEEEIDLREQLDIYLQRWPWFLVCSVLAVALALCYLYYATPVYKTVATIIIKDEKKGGMNQELSAFADMGLLNGMGTNSIENEIGILRSKSLMSKVVKDLHLNVRYFQEEGIRTRELFTEKPFNIQLLNFKASLLPEDEEPLYFTINSPSGFTIENPATDWKKEAGFGEAVTLPFGEILVTPNFPETDPDVVNITPVKVTFKAINDVVEDYRERIQVNLTDKNSSLIELGLDDPIRERAQRILDQLIHQYNREAIEDKNLVSMNTANFIEERLQIITQELDSVETGKELFKKENHLTDIQAESQLFIENASDFRKRQQDVATQLELVNTMLDYLKSDDTGLLPSNLGFEEQGVVTVIQNYNQLVLERDRILAGSTERNPVIINLNKQITQIKANVLQSLNNLRTSLRIARDDLNAQEASIEAQIATVPSKEKQFRDIERQQNIKEALYLFLLEKREETSLSLAVTAPKAKIVDSAYSSILPVAPKKKIVLLAALILGLLVPFLMIYVKTLLFNKVESRKDIEKIAGLISIVGEMPKLSRKETDIIQKHDHSVLAESFRILYTNLKYLSVKSAEGNTAKVILTTSTVKGEGKTFVSMNLGITIANTGKKVVIVGADTRNPQLHRYLPKADRRTGVTEFLADPEVTLDELVQSTDIHPNLSVLLSGSIPPNPAELWQQGRTNELFATLRDKYDYVIIDSAPSLLVTDTFLINKYADTTLYVLRAGVTEKKMIEFPLDAIRDHKLHDVAFVLNDVEIGNFGYGNKYGYAYHAEQPGIFSRLRGTFAK